MCDGSIATMFSNQSRMSYCWVVYCNEIWYKFIWFFFKYNFSFYFIFFAANNQSNERLTTTETRSNAITSSSGALPSALSTANPTIFSRRETSYARTEQNREIDDDNLSSLHLMLEPHLRPAEPDPNSEFSKQIFEDHKRLAKEYLKVNIYGFCVISASG